MTSPSVLEPLEVLSPLLDAPAGAWLAAATKPL